eukprot:TRINITY_DN12005_c0_g6_i3.p1 TRINITY_DN12005_c0_g6~~TRINITY_DN12005_c0_g6_i3.p1  ORF type:complete len:629 (+),score=55.78 TRINITY_DN12005_c0_g6_i3:1-1887(+)
MASVEPSWAELPLELLQHIFKYVDDLQLLTSVAATCVSWRAAVMTTHISTGINFANLNDPYCVHDQDIHLLASLFGSQLRKLDLTGCGNLTASSFECLLHSFPNLNELVLNGSSIYYLSEKALTQISSLIRLEMRNASISLNYPVTFQMLLGANLKVLIVDNTYHLSNWDWLQMTRLRELHMSHVATPMLEQLRELSELQTFVISKSNYIHATGLGQLVQLRELRIQHSSFLRPSSFPRPPDCVVLKDLLEHMTSLVVLELSHVRLPELDDNVLTIVAQYAPQLQALVMRKCLLTNHAAILLQGLPDLRRLTIHNEQGLSPSALLTIAESHPLLEVLDIPQCDQVHDDSLVSICNVLSKLRILNLSRWFSLSSQALEPVATLTCLERLDLHGLHHVLSGGPAWRKSLLSRGVQINCRSSVRLRSRTDHTLPICGLVSPQVVQAAILDPETLIYTKAECHCQQQECAACGMLIYECDALDHAEVCVERRVPCVLDMLGCDFVGTLAERQQHLSECLFNLSLCPLCRKPFSTGKVKEHYESHFNEGAMQQSCPPLQCPMRKEGCLFRSSNAGATHRHIQICPHWVVYCVGCGEDVPRARLEAHRQNHCARNLLVDGWYLPAMGVDEWSRC